MESATILIVAKNAGATIARAVQSSLYQNNIPILLVDDNSNDQTATVAKKIGGERIHVVRNDLSRGIGYARQIALSMVDTRYAIWMDADDEMLSGRAESLISLLHAKKAALAFDGAELVDGDTGAYIRSLPIPSFMFKLGSPLRLFERNYLPGPAWYAFDVEQIRMLGGYDTSLDVADEYDLILRVLQSKRTIALSKTVGYRQFAYPTSVSRQLVRQRTAVAKVLRKHAYEDVKRLYQDAGFSRRLTAWGLCSMAVFCEDYKSAMDFLVKACPANMRPDEVLEPEGPCPFPEGWRHSFALGTLHLLKGEPNDAIDHLTDALGWRRSAEVLNNLGVAYSKIDDREKSVNFFKQAREMFPGYLDARLNCQSEFPCHVTTHPLRIQPSRREY